MRSAIKDATHSGGTFFAKEITQPQGGALVPPFSYKANLSFIILATLSGARQVLSILI